MNITLTLSDTQVTNTAKVRENEELVRSKQKNAGDNMGAVPVSTSQENLPQVKQ